MLDCAYILSDPPLFPTPRPLPLSGEIPSYKDQLSWHMVLLFSYKVWVWLCAIQEVGRVADPGVLQVPSISWFCFDFYRKMLKKPVPWCLRRLSSFPPRWCGWVLCTERWPRSLCLALPSGLSAPLTLGADRMQNNILRKFDSWGCCASLIHKLPLNHSGYWNKNSISLTLTVHPGGAGEFPRHEVDERNWAWHQCDYYSHAFYF